ncbi:hypothetical protein SOMG_03543 [Schizosaccharomyces osmophilus]|uniref:Uncharacterized protein n=1 Tax=Schizosaccharomyces osmophilus TaxID=2545709 RepID=A0AAF0AWS3_9SCHI|nr:uncharacterized protein SOMG_03543 [Schizosaccharomyces osmophilus]WBW73189.1 hypothetical protein SOMG_03543 [Schizosaccharomyces osmophilus]
MNQDLFTNPFGIPPPSDDSYASLRRFTNEFEVGIPQDQFDTYKDKLANLLKALASKFQGDTPSQDNTTEIREMLQEFNEKFGSLEQEQKRLREEMIQAQSSLTERLESQADIISRIQQNDSKINRFVADDTKSYPFIEGLDLCLSCMN